MDYVIAFFSGMVGYWLGNIIANYVNKKIAMYKNKKNESR